MKKNLLFLCIALFAMLWVGCEPQQQAGGETLIRSISIKNTTCQGVVDTTTNTVLFDAVPAEVPVEALQFDARLSLGASLEKSTYDFTSGASEDGKQYIGTIKVVNRENSRDYQVTINLNDPVSNPKLAKLIMKKADGIEVTAGITDESVALNMVGETEATFVSIELYPARASYKFTAMSNDKLKAADPGQLVVEFMGKKTVYNITFAAAPTPGADLTAPVVYDFSAASEAGVYSEFSTENTRGSDFDGEHVLIVSRSDATTPTHHLLKVSDLRAGVINKIPLNKTGVEGGEYVVSAGRLSHGHIYVCNLVTALGDGQTLKVYHYADPTSAPDVWEWDGSGLGVDKDGDSIIVVPRLGDNISINLDESGNGYAFFCGQEGSAERMYRVDVANFNEFSNPTQITLSEAFPYYGFVNQVDQDRYLLTSHYMSSIWLINKDGEMITDIMFSSTESGLKPQSGVDPRVIKYNSGYYLLFATPYNNGKRVGAGPGVFMVDITEGAQVSIEKGLQDLSDLLWEDEEGLWEPDFHHSLDPTEPEANKTISACAAQCNAAVVDGKLLVYAAAVGAGFTILEFPAAK